ncbi:MoaD/ThiS family protein [Mycobacterium deserti]|uniref:Molybdopterin synthase sulfur carrier subunit n=1 Tax=Mycobacterium deserti TaxID=2978347 RepID=A0ABT2M5Q2_9MYCO|nr:MoaD/ThiS family protein [Mycobacterium deserti]MCT7657584.1 MoaD/ThiS family protein [Mycobacterium deserti]
MSAKVTVRYFAAARAAAGIDEEMVAVVPGTTVADLVGQLGQRDAQLANVLRRCSFLCDGIAVRDQDAPVQNAQTIDVLPPFAGG